MPYKLKKDRRKYDHAYNEFKKKQMSGVKKALANGDLALAKRILNTKPSIRIRPSGRKRRTPRRKRR